MCLNLNFVQLRNTIGLVKRNNEINNSINSKKTRQALSFINHNTVRDISLLNGTAKILPFTAECMDRVIALESAQHFKPLIRFIEESRRILRHDVGLLVVAIPVMTMAKSSLSLTKIHEFVKLGILSLMWASEHYELEFVKSLISRSGFDIINIEHIGSHVYEPLADYYAQNRKAIKSIILRDNIIINIIISPKYSIQCNRKSCLQLSSKNERSISEGIYRLCSDKGKAGLESIRQQPPLVLEVFREVIAGL